MGASLPVVVFVLTKMASLPGRPAVKVGWCGLGGAGGQL